MTLKKIVIVENRTPTEDVNDILRWFSQSFGLISKRDSESSCFRVFIEFVKNRSIGLKSDELAQKTNLSRGTVVHHIHTLERNGLIIHNENKYFLRATGFSELVNEIRKDSERMFDKIDKIAQKLDKKLNTQ
jgi:predicted transcriptional regulator